MGGLLSISLVVPLGVHEGWWAKNSGDFLLAGAAIFAAAVAAFVSTENRRKELAQDRYLRDREHIRDTLDATMSAAQTAVGNFYAHVAPREAFRDEQRQRAQHAVPPQTAEARERKCRKSLELRETRPDRRCKSWLSPKFGSGFACRRVTRSRPSMLLRTMRPTSFSWRCFPELTITAHKPSEPRTEPSMSCATN